MTEEGVPGILIRGKIQLMRSIVSPLIPGRVQVRPSLRRPEHAWVFLALLKWDYFIRHCQTLTEVQ